MLGKGSEPTDWRICHEIMSLKRTVHELRSSLKPSAFHKHRTARTQKHYASTMPSTLRNVRSGPLRVLAGLIRRVGQEAEAHNVSLGV